MRVIRLIIADDHSLLRQGLRSLLRRERHIQIVGEAANGDELISLVNEYQPDVVLTDIKMPVLDGIEATKQIKALGNASPEVVALTMFEDQQLIIDMLEAGAKGYLLKNAERAEVIAAIEAAYVHKAYFCSTTSKVLSASIAESDFNPFTHIPKPEFTPRELQIIEGICNDLSNKEIAAAYDINKRTVEAARTRIMHKLRVRGTAGIVVYALRYKLIDENKLIRYNRKPDRH